MRLDIKHIVKRPVFTVRKWGDPVLVEWFKLSTSIVNTSNFQVIQLFNTDLNGNAWPGAVSKFQRVDYNFLRSIQKDEGPEQYGTVDAKMNWFVNHTGKYNRPYWFDGDFRFGTLVFGGQKVEVETEGGQPKEYVFKGKFRGGDQTTVFYRVQGMRKSEMGKVTFESHPWKIQHATSAMWGDVYNEFPRGFEHLHPVWSDIDWPSNMPDTRLFVARVSLEGGVM